MCKICNNNYEELKKLDCNNCPLLTTIPNIKGLKEMYCIECPLLTNIPNIEGLNILYCINCPLLITIPNIEGLNVLVCNNCPLLMYAPLLADNENLKKPFENCIYKTSKKMDKLYNNIYYLWKYYKLNQYVNYLLQHVYSNPRLPYMKYYIEHNLYDTNNGRLKIGYINSKEELIFYHL